MALIVMAESYSQGTTSYWTNPRRVKWVKILLRYRQTLGSSSDDPKPTDPLRIIKGKILKALNNI